MISVKLELSRRSVSRGATVESALASAVVQAAGFLGTEARARVQGRGDTGGQGVRPWSSKPYYPVSPRYPDGVQGRVSPSGAEWFPSSAEFHRRVGVRPGTFSTTGGMWGGLSVLVEGRYYARIAFRGRSEGQSPNFTTGVRGRNKGRVVARPLKVNNALKAATVLRLHGVHVLAPTAEELTELSRRLALSVAHAVGSTIGVEWKGGVLAVPSFPALPAGSP